MSGLPPFPPGPTWAALVDLALAEDLGTGDVTSTAVLPAELRNRAVIEAREPMVVCGLPLVHAVFAGIDPSVSLTAKVSEGDAVAAGEILIDIEGPARGILASERTALNFLGRLCGVATWTRRYVDAVAGTEVAIVDTRKTVPGFRSLDKYAVALGGGTNHRAGLYDAILIKDNHIAAAGGVAQAVKAARTGAPPHLQIQVEVECEEDAQTAIDAGAHLLLLDNQTPEGLEGFVRRFRDRIPLEATGGVTLDNVRRLAETGVHRISIGALTHSAPNADVALEIATQ